MEISLTPYQFFISGNFRIMDIISNLFAILLLIIAGIIAYGSAHCAAEERRGKHIPLPWEKKKEKTFNKADVEYRDGDNT
jgi:hypothetical protein